MDLPAKKLPSFVAKMHPVSGTVQDKEYMYKTVQGRGYSVQGTGYRIHGGTGCMVYGTWYMVQVTGYRVQGTR